MPDDRVVSMSYARAFCGGVGRTAWWEWGRDGRLPAPVQLGPRRKGYRLSDLQAFVASRITKGGDHHG